MRAVKLIRVVVRTTLHWKCFSAKGGHWVGVCDALKLTVQADTWAELMEDIGHTLDMMLKDLLRSNELEKFLRDHGWTVAGTIPSAPARDLRFDVPFIPAMIGSPYGSQGNVHQ
jgi:predicted RNase H-like HicB family nuclease